MKPAPFKYVAASSLDHALQLKAEYGDEARFLAGGQSLMPAMNFRLARPGVLIDLNPLSDCAGVVDQGPDLVRIGALTRYRELERDANFLRRCPLFAEALPHIAHPQIRNRGTIGGNCSHADPASEMPALSVAMQARIKLRSASAEREVAAADFFVGLLTTDIQDDEMMVELVFPVPKPRAGNCFMEVARRRGDFALAGVAASVTLDDDANCTDVRLALCGVGETPVDASATASALIGQHCRDELIADLASEVGEGLEPAGNVHATPDYQRHVAQVLIRRALGTAVARAADGV